MHDDDIAAPAPTLLVPDMPPFDAYSVMLDGSWPQRVVDEGGAVRAGHTPGPWGWVIEDHSMASLGVLPDPGLGNPLVLTVSPCKACADRAEPKEWVWGRCHTPSEDDARLISSAPDLLATLARIARNCQSDYGRFEIGF